jgi:hypothetical protein
MGLLKQIRSLLVSISLSIFLAAIIVLGTGSGLAAIALTPIVSQAHYIATASQDIAILNDM